MRKYSIAFSLLLICFLTVQNNAECQSVNKLYELFKTLPFDDFPWPHTQNLNELKEEGLFGYSINETGADYIEFEVWGINGTNDSIIFQDMNNGLFIMNKNGVSEIPSIGGTSSFRIYKHLSDGKWKELNELFFPAGHVMYDSDISNIYKYNPKTKTLEVFEELVKPFDTPEYHCEETGRGEILKQFVWKEKKFEITLNKPPGFKVADPEQVVVDFINALGAQEFRKAFDLTENPKWGKYENFCSPKAFGGIKGVQIHSHRVSGKEMCVFEVFTDVTYNDPINGDKRFEQEFSLTAIDYKWKITNMKVIRMVK